MTHFQKISEQQLLWLYDPTQGWFWIASSLMYRHRRIYFQQPLSASVMAKILLKILWTDDISNWDLTVFEKFSTVVLVQYTKGIKRFSNHHLPCLFVASLKDCSTINPFKCLCATLIRFSSRLCRTRVSIISNLLSSLDTTIMRIAEDLKTVWNERRKTLSEEQQRLYLIKSTSCRSMIVPLPLKF